MYKHKFFEKFLVLKIGLTLYACSHINRYTAHDNDQSSIYKSDFENRFKKIVQDIGSDTGFDPDFATIDILNIPPYRLRDVLCFVDSHIAQRNYATYAKKCAENALNRSIIDGNRSYASAYKLAADSAGSYASCAHKCRIAISEICRTQDHFSEAVINSANVFNSKKIIKWASKNNDAYVRYFGLKNELCIAYQNYVSAARKAIDIYHQTPNLSLKPSTLHSDYVSAAEKAIYIYEKDENICIDPSKTDSYMGTSNSICNDNNVIDIKDPNDHDRTIIIEESGEHEIITIGDELVPIQHHEVITIDDES